MHQVQHIDKKIGLMYVSDYYYSASPSAWTLFGNSSDTTKSYCAATSTNWLYLGSDEWTISHTSDTTVDAFIVYLGCVAYYLVTTSNAVRPSFNLLSSVTYASGTGTNSDPIRIN